jgi:hypothetical protein
VVIPARHLHGRQDHLAHKHGRKSARRQRRALDFHIEGNNRLILTGCLQTD